MDYAYAGHLIRQMFIDPRFFDRMASYDAASIMHLTLIPGDSTHGHEWAHRHRSRHVAGRCLHSSTSKLNLSRFCRSKCSLNTPHIHPKA